MNKKHLKEKLEMLRALTLSFLFLAVVAIVLSVTTNPLNGMILLLFGIICFVIWFIGFFDVTEELEKLK